MSKAERRRINLRNLRKAHRARRHRKNYVMSPGPVRNRGRRNRKRNPAGMPVLLVNPENPMRKNRHRRRRHRRHHNRARHLVHGYTMRRRGRRVRVHGHYSNPRSKNWTAAFWATGLGMLGGGAAYLLDWGIASAPISETWRAVALGGSGAVIAIGVARFGNENFAAGIAGGVGLALVQRVRNVIALSGTEPKAAATPAPAAASGMFGSGAGRVYARGRGASAVFHESGALVQRVGRPSSGRAPSLSPTTGSFKDAGVSRYIPGPIRWFGPRSWAYGPQASGAGRVRYVSAHSRRRVA